MCYLIFQPPSVSLQMFFCLYISIVVCQCLLQFHLYICIFLNWVSYVLKYIKIYSCSNRLLVTLSFCYVQFGSKVVALRDTSPGYNSTISNKNNYGLSDSGIISREDLPHPSKLRKRKKSSNSRRNRTGMEVDAHLALLRRKHAEFNW